MTISRSSLDLLLAITDKPMHSICTTMTNKLVCITRHCNVAKVLGSFIDTIYENCTWMTSWTLLFIYYEDTCLNIFQKNSGTLILYYILYLVNNQIIGCATLFDVTYILHCMKNLTAIALQFLEYQYFFHFFNKCFM